MCHFFLFTSDSVRFFGKVRQFDVRPEFDELCSGFGLFGDVWKFDVRSLGDEVRDVRSSVFLG